MSSIALKEWLNLPEDTRKNIFEQTAIYKNLPAQAIEKDWWVTFTLKLIFEMECAPAMVFKGGTSLSKGWGLIERFSEDIDLALDKEHLGFTNNNPSKKEVNQLRRLSYNYITTKFTPELQAKFNDAGLTGVTVKHQEVVNHDQDPLIVEIYYPKLTEPETYLKPGLLVEVGSRSLKEPYTVREFGTMVAESFPAQPFADKPIAVPVVNPERTFLEKIFLLHEEFQRAQDVKRIERLSRHLYDIEKLMDTEFAEKALHDRELYQTIVSYRSIFTKFGGIDYASHNPKTLKFIPPAGQLPLWEADYRQMQESMIYGNTLPFKQLIDRLTVLQERINSIIWK